MTQYDHSEAWFPLSAAQLSRWFMYRLDAKSQGLHNNGFAAKIASGMTPALLQSALQRLVARHPMLRAHFRENDGEPQQCIMPAVEVTVTSIDTSGLGEASLRQQISKDCSIPFNLTHPPLIRGHLYQCNSQESIMLLVFDHIVGDGWSYWQILDELSSDLVSCRAEEQFTQEPEDAASTYMDYISWQKEWIASAEGVSELAYWKEKLSGSLPILVLPTDRPRSTAGDARPQTISLDLPASLTQELRTLAQKYSSTLYVVLLAAYKILLYRHTGQEDSIVGSPMPARRKREWDKIVGDFVNPIAIRTTIGAHTSVTQILKEVRSAALRGMRHQDYPFSQLVDQLHTSRDFDTHPIFQTMFIFQKARSGAYLTNLWSTNETAKRLEWGGFSLEAYPVHQSGGVNKLPLIFEAIEANDAIRCDFKFNPDLFDSISIEGLAERYRVILSEIVKDQEQSVGALNILCERERKRVLKDFNATDAELPQEQLIHRMFEAHAAAQPDAVALVFEGSRLTYGELNRRANQIAHHLISLGIGPDDRVAICMQRSLDMVCAMFGVLKSGGAYVPLDPDYPADRLAYMLDDSAPVALLTQSDFTGRWPALHIPVVPLDDVDAPLPMHPAASNNPPDVALQPHHLAYVIYTSGSTGLPKGAMNEHRAVANRLHWMQQAFPLDSTDRVLQKTPFSFDVSVWEFFWPLQVGAQLIIAKPEGHKQPDYLVKLIDETQVTTLHFVPSMLQAFVDQSNGWHNTSVRRIFCSGEALPPVLRDRFFDTWSDIELHNLYGPTEAAIDVTWFACSKSDASHIVPIGRPISNTQMYVLDAAMQPVPVGVTGELYIGGVGVARGYLNRPDLTAERFIHDPFSTEPDARLYKTGDLGRWLADGNIEYLGRNDFQVKIRGFRIELGEVETNLCACDGVREAVVIAREDSPGDKRLVAYFVSEPGSTPNAASLRTQLASRLAEHMLPAAFVALDSFPLTPNGKLDRKALPAPDRASLLSIGDYEAPVGDVEAAIASIWQSLLGLPKIGRHDHFFELGGHSLLALRLVSRIHQELGVELSLQDLFTQPTVAGLAHMVQGAKQSFLPPIATVDRSGALPLSWAQQRLWFLDRLNPAASMAYAMPAGLRLGGPLDSVALQATLDRILARHETLRTRFAEHDGEPVQIIAPADVGFTLLRSDLSDLPTSEQTAAVHQLCEAEFGHPFDLTAGPLIRGRLIRLSQQDHVLLITQHHIISDGWSIEILVQEISALYQAFSQGDADPLPALPVQYADYAVWQRGWLQAQMLERRVDFWKSYLAGAPSLLELPTDRPRPAQQSYAGSKFLLSLSPALTASLRTLSQRHGVTLFMTLLAGWSVLMARLSGQQDVVIGSPVANRQRSEVESLIGFFVNTLPLRVRMDGAASVAELLLQVKRSALDAYAHQDLPFEKMVEAVNPQRSMAYSPIFQVMLAMNHALDGENLSLAGLRVDPLELAHSTTQFDLSLSLADAGETITGNLEYASDLFDATTIAQLAQRFQNLLGAMVADDRQLVSHLPLLCEHERERILRDFNATDAVFPQEQLIHRLFEAQAATQPDAVALVFEGSRLTYGELNRRANQIAHHLIALGIGPDDRVAICMQRSLDMVCAMLGVLKAGGAYVPLDPAYPADRLAYMLDDSAPVALLTQAALKAHWPALHIPVVALDDVDAPLPTHPVASNNLPDVALQPHHLAYVIYTSGSTGLPKGVMIEHRNAANLIHAHIDICKLGKADKVLQFASFGFDSSVAEIFPALSAGACVIMRPAKLQAPDAEFVQFLHTHRITAVDLPTAFWRQWCQDFQRVVSHPLEFLRLVIVSGEKSELRHLQQWLAIPQVSGIRWLNNYGPTECTVNATSIAFESGMPLPAYEIPIGRPISNTQMYVLDAAMQPVPVGVTGELYIGGVGVARGYLNRPDLTAERFIHDPFSTEPDARLYKTGDLGRWLADGNIEYLGRNDFQVKIRGFRIELGEVETNLCACDGVREAVVIAREDSPGDKRLVAYFVSEPGSTPNAASLRTQLASRLAEHMLPAAFVALDSFPLTPNGKLDRKALPAPDRASLLSIGDYEAPVGDVEAAIASIWQSLLGLPKIGRHDHFFELGGHSLLALRLVSRIHQELGVELSLQDLFTQPTVAGLAHMVQGAKQSFLPPIATVDRSGALPLSWAQQRLWFLDRLNPAASMAYAMPAGLRLGGPLDSVALQATLDRILARHETLRTRFAEHDGEPVQIIAPADVGFTLLRSDLSDLPTSEQTAAVHQLCEAEFGHPFDLTAGPLIRGRLIRLSQQDHVLLITQHHIISDGWSIEILVQEISALYQAFSQGDADPLPALPVQYADYAVWQRGWLQAQMLERRVDFWKSYLAGAPSLLELPTDRPRPAQQSYAGSKFLLSLSPALTASLRTLSQRHGVTLFMTLLAGWSVLMARLSGQQDVVIGSPVANRQRSEVESLIGFFVNTLPLRVRMDGAASVAELLLQVKRSALDAYAHQDLPFEKMVEAVNPQRSMAYSPIFQVMLAMNHALDGENLSLAGLRVDPLELAHSTTQFDLSLSLADAGETITGNLEYASDLFDATTIAQLAQRFQNLLGAMVADDRQLVSHLPLLCEHERERILRDFNATDAVFPQEQLIHRLFEAQAATQPDAVALVFEGSRLTYGELNRRANQIAHHLIALGIGPDDRVAICMQRSLDMVCAMLGVLKAGGAYVPLDPAYPADRLAYMLDDSAPVALLTQAALKAHWPALRIPVVALDDVDAPLPTHPVASNNLPDVALQPHHLAYVIYTSGSTGLPKGVMIEHRNAANFVGWAMEAFTKEQLAVTLFSTSINFDLAIFELFVPLSLGCTVTLVKNILASSHDLREVSLINTVPSAIQTLLDAGRIPESASQVNLAGEPLKRALVEKIFAQTRVQSIANLYGPSETTTYSTWVDMDRKDGFLSHIGRPIANTQVYILDAAMQPVSVGVTGELYIGGVGVARGYLNRPDLTAERFIHDPFSTEPDARLYKTGDLGRWLADGNIEYLGRNDFQVKIRGFRIELGEVETNLCACDGVREAVVIAREDSPGDKRLVAYFVSEPGSTPNAASLRTQLASRLAEHMLPAAFVALDSFPLTPNGKLDRKALPAPDRASLLSIGDYEAPVGDVEAAIASIWQSLLGLPKIGRHDHFFELGGHSLLAVRLTTALHKEFNVHVSLSTFFTQPTVAALAQSIEHGDAATDRKITVLPQAENYALSQTQLRMWLFQNLNPASTTYHVSGMMDTPDEVDIAAMAEILGIIVKRQASLRTVFVSTSEGPRQVILPTMPVQVTSAVVTREASLDQIYAEHAILPFDLKTGPLFHACLVEGPTGKTLLWSMHHIIADGLSIDILQREARALIANHLRDQQNSLPDLPDLPDLPVQYVDYAAWQNTGLMSSAQESKTYWHNQLAGELPILDLPYDYPAAEQSHAVGAAFQCILPKDISQRLIERGKQRDVSQFNTLLSGFLVLLWRLTGQDDLIVGTPVAGREHPDVEHLIGCFINTVMLRNKINAEESIADFMQRVSKNTLQALAHQNYPFEQLVDEVKAPQYANRFPISSVFLNHLSSETSQAHSLAHGMGHRALDQDVKFDLNIYTRESEQGLVFDCHYRTACFKADTIEYIFTQYIDLLGSLAESIESPCSGVDVFTLDANRLSLPAQIIAQPFIEFKDTDIEQSIPDRFAAQVEQHPERIAIKTSACTMTYRELDIETDRVAHAILTRCGASNDRVALLFEHGAPMIIGLLGALKAGKAYVPLDPAYPEARLAFMFENSQAKLLVTNNSNMQFAQSLTDGAIPIINLDKLPSYQHDDALAAAVDPDHLAYILYTSGSTGQPKGVMQSHRNALYFCKNYTNNLHIGTQDRVLLLASYCFDAAVMDIFGALMNGATLCPLDPKSMTQQEILAQIKQEGITIYHSTPTLFRHLFGEESDEILETIRLVVLGGELVTRDDVVKFKRGFNDQCVFINGYGPTESTLALQNFITKETDVADKGIPAGQAIRGTSIVLGCPEEQPRAYQKGEVIIKNQHVALGYWARPELNGKAFGVDSTGARYYRTGDIGYYSPDGNVTIRGRIDHQVKIRGFRIELGEIESTLNAIPGIRETVAIARQDRTGDTSLVAYIVLQETPSPSTHSPLSPETIRRFVSDRLPGYMVPSAIVVLDAIPLTPSGKIDRLSLPAPAAADASTSYVPPRTETERALATLWREILKSDNVGIHDNFFAIGGHSLLASQLIARVRTAFQLELPLLAIFEAPTIEALAHKIELANAHAANVSIPEISPAPRGNLMPTSFSQQQLWFLDQLDDAAGAAYHMSASLRMKGQLNREALRKALDRIVARHEILRTVFVISDDHVFQSIEGPEQGFDLCERRIEDVAQDEKERELALADAEEIRRPFDLATGPLIRGQLICMGEEDHALIVTMHHIISDGWSIGVLVRELRALYTAHCLDQLDPLPPLTIQYADYSAWQRDRLQGEHLRSLVDYWKNNLTGAPTLMNLPLDHARPPKQNYVGENFEFVLSKELTLGVRELAQRHGATLFMTLLATWSALLARMSRQTDLVIGTPIANRQHKEIEPLIGFFVNTLALRIHLEDHLPLSQILANVKSNTLNAYAHQELPFNQVVKALNPARNMSHSPIFQVMMTMNNTPSDESLTLPGLVLSDIEKAQNTTHYDLSLTFTDSDDVLSGNLIYASDLFNATTVERIVENFKLILSAFIANDRLGLHELPYQELANDRLIILTQEDGMESTGEIFEEQLW